MPITTRIQYNLNRSQDIEVIGVSLYLSCHGNTIATRYVANACFLVEALYLIWTQYDLRQKSY